ncbi:hypothetical protein [Candidatus Uabimicrobium sp. HlEnr_7]|uniref:hypothetical protein n=1 Tax=Candidatus Uabimicrobium helgolandensis TaxID=3095367 RepID=UPI0035563511
MEISENLQLQLANSNDFMSISSLRARDNDKNANIDYLQYWYEKNPNSSYSIAICKVGEETEGVASTNNFVFNIQNHAKQVAMPQKVLTSPKIRGQGIFGKLYRMTEADNLAKGIDCFFTFTNAMSTPIFLQKFNYTKGQSPQICLLVANPLHCLRLRKPYIIVDKFCENYWQRDLLQIPNAMVKNASYYKWRYQDYKSNMYIKLRSPAQNNGYVVLKKMYKKKIAFFALLDIITDDSKNITELITIAYSYASSRLSLGLMVCYHQLFSSALDRFYQIRFNDRLNFLVKGKTLAETEMLNKIKFSFTFGDFDFV